MDYKRFVLSYYKNAIQGIHIQRIACTEEAQKPHSHSYFQIYYVLKGSLLHSTAQAEAHLSAGDMFLIPPSAVHCIRSPRDTEIYTFSFMPDIFGEAGDSNRVALGFLRSLPSEHALFAKADVSREDSEQAKALLDKIYLEFSEKKLGFGEAIRAYALLLITILARSHAGAIPPEAVADETAARIEHCAKYMDANFSEEISLSEMAAACAMSKSFFCKSFLAHTGMTFHRYLQGCRIRAALKYMEKGYKITAIYGLCGYSDFSTFYRNFKKITGCSPKAYFSSGEGAPQREKK